MSFDIKLEEIQSLHVQPLMSETGNEVVCSRVLNQAIHLSPQVVGITELLLLCESKQLGIRRGTPEEIRQTHGQFEIAKGTRGIVLAGTPS